LFDDIRQLGCIRWLGEKPDRLGPDPLEIGAEEFARRLRARRSQVKRLLLDQRFVRGLGNIYADETLFRARIHPLALASRLSRERVLRLYQAGKSPADGIANGSSSISDYVDANGRAGTSSGFTGLR
jgi:formamidopyrimidine-DNA glycosylase